jgi:hypothetical protein
MYTLHYYGKVGGMCLAGDTDCISEWNNRKSNVSVIVPILVGSTCFLCCMIFCIYRVVKKGHQNLREHVDPQYDPDFSETDDSGAQRRKVED